MTTVKHDPYMINVAALNQMKDDMSMASSGLICPKRNKSIGATCKVCDYIQSQVWSKQYPEKHPARNWAYDKGASATFFLNVVFPENKEEVKILEIGSKAGNQIFDGVNKAGWTDITHPKKGMGREMMITKGKDGKFNVYTVSPDLNKADWEVKKGTLAGRFNLTNIISMIQNNELNDSNHIKVSSIKDGEVLRFRILPKWDNDAGNENFMAVVWRHWGTTQDQIDGKEGINWQDVELKIEDDAVKPTKEVSFKPDKEPDKVNNDDDNKPPRCFGNSSYYDPKDEDCTMAKCKFSDECIALINK